MTRISGNTGCIDRMAVALYGRHDSTSRNTVDASIVTRLPYTAETTDTSRNTVDASIVTRLPYTRDNRNFKEHRGCIDLNSVALKR